jgi:exosortase/archaeosortase family protein
MRMMFALVMVSFAFAVTAQLRAYVRFLIVFLSPVSAVLCNVLRIIPTLWVYGHAEAATAQRFHDLSGWVMLFVAFMLLVGVVRLLRWLALPVSPFILAVE